MGANDQSSLRRIGRLVENVAIAGYLKTWVEFVIAVGISRLSKAWVEFVVEG